MTIIKNVTAPPTHDAQSESAEAVVVGGGLAGAGVASLLAQTGRKVLLLERGTTAKHKICGEFLSTETQYYLRRLGLDLDALGGHPTGRMRLVRHHTIVETALPFRGLGLSRRRLDEALLDHAGRCGAEVRRGQRVSVLRTQPIDLDIKGANPVRANTLFLATGKHDLRPLRRQPENDPEDLVGFKMYFDVPPAQRRAMQGCVELVLFAHGYAGLQQVENGQINLCLLVERAWFKTCGGDWDSLLQALLRTCPHLKQRFGDATPLLAQPLSIYRVPYGFVHRPESDASAQIYRLGDQAGVIPSFSGDGMGMAMHSAALAAASYLAADGADNYHRRFRHDIARQMRRAELLYRISRGTFSQPLLMRLARLYPRSLQLAAKLTRVPSKAVART